MRTERAAQGLSQRDAATRGGISTLTWSQVELAKTKPRDFTLAGIERGLGWPPGTAAGVMAGAEPPPPGTSPGPTSLPSGFVDDETVDLAAEVAAVRAESAATHALLLRVARHLGVDLSDLDGA